MIFSCPKSIAKLYTYVLEEKDEKFGFLLSSLFSTLATLYNDNVSLMSCENTQ